MAAESLSHDNTDSKPVFQWTDEYVKEFADNLPVDEMTNQSHIDNFKKSKEQPEEAVVPIKVEYFRQDFGGCHTYKASLNAPIPEEKYEDVKLAIEKVLNGGTLIAKPDGNGGYVLTDNSLNVLIPISKSPTSEKNYHPDKLPVGIKPTNLYYEQRLSDVEAAIKRYKDVGKKYPPEWYTELLLLKSLINLNK